MIYFVWWRVSEAGSEISAQMENTFHSLSSMIQLFFMKLQSGLESNQPWYWLYTVSPRLFMVIYIQI